MKAVLVVCEGRHDVVFVQKSLAANGECREVKKRIGQLPSPFGKGKTTHTGLLAGRFARSDVEGLTMAEAARSPEPWFGTPFRNKSGNTIFFPVWTGGKGATNSVRDLLQDLQDAFEPDLLMGNDVQQYAIAFLFDADEVGVAKTLERFRERYADQLGDLDGTRHASWTTGTTVPVGCFVFHRGPTDPKGTLEDHLEPMAEQAWPDRYPEAHRFVEEQRQPTDQASKNNAYRVKATIAVSGQFDYPGAPMTTMIQKRLNQEHFHASALSCELAKFLSNTPWKRRGDA